MSVSWIGYHQLDIRLPHFYPSLFITSFSIITCRLRNYRLFGPFYTLPNYVIHINCKNFRISGHRLAESNLEFKWREAFSIIFAAMSPLGGAIGLIVSQSVTGGTALILNGVLQSIAGGTFLYITFFEIIPKEFSIQGNPVLKLLAVIVGFMVVATLMFFTDWLRMYDL